MKVVFVRHSLLNRGGDKMVIAHANALAERNHTVVIFAGKVDTVFAVSEAVEIRQIGKGSIISTLLSCLSFRFEADRIVADIIPLALCLFFRNRNRVVYFAQDYDEEYYSSVFLKLFIRFQYFISLSIFKIPVVAVSDYLAEIFMSRFKVTAAVVVNGIDNRRFFPERDPELVHLKKNRKAILVLARNDKRKGADLLEDVFSSLNENPEMSFVVWSVGDHMECPDPGIEIENFGFVEETSLRRLMSSADLFLYPTRHEGFGLMPLEAMACGCPVVTTAAVRILTHEKNALLSPVQDIPSMTDNIERMFLDNELSQRLVAAGFNLVAEYTIEKSTSRFVEALSGSDV